MNATRPYWELRAEQVMDRVFQPVVLDGGLFAASGAGTGAARREPQRADDSSIEVEVRPLTTTAPPRWLILSGGGLACVALAAAVGFGMAWRQAQAELRQERTIRLLEGIRTLPAPAATSPAPQAAAPRPATPPRDAADGLPPPPPDQAWIQELARLDGPAPAGTPPLRVPLNGTLRAPAPRPAATSPGGSAGVPELLGIVHVPGRAGSAIFQVGRSSFSVSTGELIGSSGWRLQGTSADAVLIQRGGESRRVSIGAGV